MSDHKDTDALDPRNMTDEQLANATKAVSQQVICTLAAYMRGDVEEVITHDALIDDLLYNLREYNVLVRDEDEVRAVLFYVLVGLGVRPGALGPFENSSPED